MVKESTGWDLRRPAVASKLRVAIPAATTLHDFADSDGKISGIHRLQQPTSLAAVSSVVAKARQIWAWRCSLQWSMLLLVRSFPRFHSHEISVFNNPTQDQSGLSLVW